ncbi:GIY-YIG nuclease family protein [Devosia submarina]|uniref:GIY-YIG nuclease family protein n=1 Tax=Devosia submarina TaxID=1173082 RepID=UPI000D3B0F5E|nr:GIY-YIG nuclease family protein [Devosia submarina]
MGQTYFVYMMANRKHGALYTGVTSDLVRRTYEHREGLADGFTKTHGCKHLVWYEVHEDIEAAILHEKRLKKWQRHWKEELIETMNPNWRDMWWEIIEGGPTT